MLERETLSGPLTWKNDPIQFDSEPLPVNQWLNANQLIEQNRDMDIFLTDGLQLNLYPVMVRKNDFVRKKSSLLLYQALPSPESIRNY